MEQYAIKGGNPLVGEVEIGGAKNAALAILAASIMTDETVIIENLPDVRDTNVLMQAMESVGATIQKVDRHIIKVNGSFIKDVKVEEATEALNEFATHRNILNSKTETLEIKQYAARRFVVDEMCRYTYAFPYVIGLVLRSTKNIINVEVNHRDRESGTSGYTLGKLLSLWFNGFTAFSVKPLRIATVTGSVCAFAGFAYGIYTIIKKIFWNPPGLVTGFSALMSVLVFMGGMLMLMLGLVGEYMGRMYVSMNNSPQYVIREKTWDASEDQ